MLRLPILSVCLVMGVEKMEGLVQVILHCCRYVTTIGLFFVVDGWGLGVGSDQ